MNNKISQKTGVRWTSVGLPAEHGSWGLVLEPIVLGLLLVPSWPGVFLALAAFFAFLAYQPLRIVLNNYRQGRSTQRTILASRFLGLYGATTILFLWASIAIAGWEPLLPTLYSAPIFILFMIYDFVGPTRSWQAEMSAPIAFSSIVAGIALAGDWALPNALALWAVMAARGVPSILYVRARLRLDKGKPAEVNWVVVMHILALALVYYLVRGSYLPVLSLLAMFILLLRAGIGLSRFHRSVRARTIGFVEIGLGVMTVLLIVIGWKIS